LHKIENIGNDSITLNYGNYENMKKYQNLENMKISKNLKISMHMCINTRGKKLS